MIQIDSIQRTSSNNIRVVSYNKPRMVRIQSVSSGRILQNCALTWIDLANWEFMMVGPTCWFYGTTLHGRLFDGDAPRRTSSTSSTHMHLLLLSTIHSFTSTTTSSTGTTAASVCVCVFACARGMHIMGGDHKRATCTRISLYMIIAIHGIHDAIHDAIHNLYIMLHMTQYIALYMTLCMPKKLCMTSGL